MTPNGEQRGGVLLRLQRVESSLHDLQTVVEGDNKALTRLDEQVTGERGLSAALDLLSGEVAGLRKAAWALAAIIVTASIGFAFGVLALIPA